MSKHNIKNADTFRENMKDIETMSEQEMLDKLNETIITVETDDTYNTAQKLKIYALITSMSNADGKERSKFTNKILKVLK